ncbi:MAG TPA: hypothetical protein PKA28_14390 [Methylomusa anaerophila]|uniref:Uncharacterized protein n=1 Tax=Methylomusa anaerophila TaxID=1930071 RepID=A0A348AEV0_9FIRM|nr:hypothetical protein [Methylomusa anaerophila]BBB89598.1 hypothetical protein MAMMFC1_00231 [Methylomusa anaerophila]HML89629.1 hypothetical protein [Methylomusa anaerophila]
MSKEITGWIVGGLIAVSAMGLAFGTNIGRAAEKSAEQPPAKQDCVMNEGQMGAMDHNMMDAQEMQKQCLEMMKSPEMQKTMKNMMKQPEMQAMMKQMLTNDPEFRQIISDLVNSVDPNAQTDNQASPADASTPPPGGMDHSNHHSSN